MKDRYKIANFDQIEATSCPCGSTQRAFTDDPDGVVSMHIVHTDGEARCHYHRRMTEVYYILDGEGQIELDGQQISVKPGIAILIKPECRHRLIGTFRFLNVPVPSFDPADEWFDEPPNETVAAR